MITYILEKKKLVTDENSVTEFCGNQRHVEEVIEALRCMWIGAVNCNCHLLHDTMLMSPFGFRAYDADSNITGDMGIAGSNILLADVSTDGYRLSTAVDRVASKSGRHAVLEDSSWKLTGRREIQKRILKDRMNKLLKTCSVVGDIHMDKVGNRVKISDDFRLVSNATGKDVNPDNLDNNEYAVWALMSIMHQMDKFLNIVFLDLKGVTDRDMVSGMIQMLMEDARPNMHLLMYIYNNEAGVSLPGQKVFSV